MIKIKPQFEVSVRPGANRVFALIGAGGTGARLGMLLPRLVSPGDTIYVVDGDSVETKNLSRQHFLAGDVGQPKADIIARRIQASMPPAVKDNVQVISIAEKFEYPMSSFTRLVGSPAQLMIILGCVDNYEARNMAYAFANRAYRPRIYIDCGNDMRWGQVVMNLQNVVVEINQSWLKSSKLGAQVLKHYGPEFQFSFDSMKHYAPGLLEPPPAPTEVAADCGIRLDTQTVSANQMAATAAGALLAQLLDGLPISAPCVEFSTVPPIMNARAFPPASPYHWNHSEHNSWFTSPPKEKADGAQAKTETGVPVQPAGR